MKSRVRRDRVGRNVKPRADAPQSFIPLARNCWTFDGVVGHDRGHGDYDRTAAARAVVSAAVVPDHGGAGASGAAKPVGVQRHARQ